MNRLAAIVAGIAGAVLAFLCFPAHAQTAGWTVYAQTAPLAVSVSPATAHVTYNTSGTKTTNSVTASASGGSGGYTYVWSYVSGDFLPFCSSTTTATTVWVATVSATDSYSATWKVTVTDSTSNTASSSVLVNFVSTY